MINKFFNNNNLSKIFFYIFIFLLPWQTRFIFLPNAVEYLGFSIYISEIFLWTALGFWLIEDYKNIKLSKSFLLFYIFILISLFWAEDKVVGFRLFLYIFEGIFIYQYIRYHKKYIINLIYIFAISLFFSTLLGLYQFINLGSPDFKWLGLATRGAWNLGDIVLDTGSGRWLRIYGSLPHPNILGGYLVVVILSLSYLVKKNNKFLIKFLNYFLIAFFILGLLLTFSRSAWLAFLVISLYFIFKNLNNKNIRKLFIFTLLLVMILGYIFYPLINSRNAKSVIENRSITERKELVYEAFDIWKQHPLLGVGIGNYVVHLEKNNQQPVHNIFLLVLVELGIIGFLLFLLLLKNILKLHHNNFFLLIFIIIGLFDHYLWSLYPGVMLFWLGVSFVELE